MSVTDAELRSDILEEFGQFQPDHIDIDFVLKQKRTISNRKAAAKWYSDAANRAKKNAWMKAYMRRPEMVAKHRAYMKARYHCLKSIGEIKSKPRPKAQPNWRRKLTMAQAKKIRLLRSEGWTIKALETEFGLTAHPIRLILKGETYVTREVNYG